MAKLKRTMDGNEAAAYASYAFTEVAAIYPITPSSPMAEAVDRWAAAGRKNIFGQEVTLVEMQSEAGAVSAMHGALDGGVLGTTYTASQGLMLMIPTMYRIAGQLKPGVIHVSSRNVATHAISIFAEHADVMACRQTGFAILASSSVQEAMDLGAVAHLAAIKGHVPFLHFFDGFRTSHEVQKIDCLDYADLAGLVDMEELNRFRKGSLNPEYPVLMTTGQNPDTYFQGREACNGHYLALPDMVETIMGQIGALTGRDYRLFNYYGAPDARRVIVAMASVSGPIQETVDYLNARGEKVGLLEVHLYRPFSARHFLDALPRSVQSITVMDRTKEPGAVGEPLYEDVCAVLSESDRAARILACRFGLAGKDTTPAQIAAVYGNMAADSPRSHFTVGIRDDVTHLSLPVGEEINTVPQGTVSCKFWGLGSDGTVGANKNTIKIIGDHTQLYVQAYFEYDGKKSGGVTRSHLRFGKQPIKSAYLVKQADFVACHNQSYIQKYDMVQELGPGGSFLLATGWSRDELEAHLPASFKRFVAENHIKLYTIDATAIARELGLGGRTNTVLQAAFFQIAGIIPPEQAARHMKAAIRKTYGKKGEQIVKMNCDAVDLGARRLVRVEIPAAWAQLPQEDAPAPDPALPAFIRDIQLPVNAMKGDDIPVSAFLDQVDGTVPQATSRYERRGIAVQVPAWRKEHCIQCNQCAYVCPHATIRPFLLTQAEQAAAPAGLEAIPAVGKGVEGLGYRMQVDVLDCTGCGSCASVCPAREKALVMEPLESRLDQMAGWDYLRALPHKANPFSLSTVKGSQFQQPLLEFSGACAGCGETPYAKLVTQLFGERMYIATATGCSQVWASSYPSFPYAKNSQGHGPAVAGSLFENNAEFGMGILMSTEKQRDRLRMNAAALAERTADPALAQALNAWLEQFDRADGSKAAAEGVRAALKDHRPDKEEAELVRLVQNNTEHLVKKSVWIFGGDGWAYDIGYGGLDHVLASGKNVNVLVFDTEIYSNTGGQSSKATPAGAVAQFADAGKRTKKKDLGRMAMTYGNVYVAQVAMGANQSQLLRAVLEAEAYDGPSLIIAYAPCISHGMKCGMGGSQGEIKRAVEAGYWHLYRYNPALKEQGKNPFSLDSGEPAASFRDFLLGQVRYASLSRSFPDAAEALYAQCEADAMERYRSYAALAAGPGR